MKRKILMWMECKYCGRDFQSFKRQKYCKPCLSRISKEPLSKSSNTMRMLRNREFISNYKKDKKCTICGYKRYPQILDFHHKNKKEKSQGVCNLAKMLKNILTIKEEIEKCVLICPNCHRELHLKERNEKNRK